MIEYKRYMCKQCDDEMREDGNAKIIMIYETKIKTRRRIVIQNVQ